MHILAYSRTAYVAVLMAILIIVACGGGAIPSSGPAQQRHSVRDGAAINGMADVWVDFNAEGLFPWQKGPQCYRLWAQVYSLDSDDGGRLYFVSSRGIGRVAEDGVIETMFANNAYLVGKGKTIHRQPPRIVSILRGGARIAVSQDGAVIWISCSGEFYRITNGEFEIIEGVGASDVIADGTSAIIVSKGLIWRYDEKGKHLLIGKDKLTAKTAPLLAPKLGGGFWVVGQELDGQIAWFKDGTFEVVKPVQGEDEPENGERISVAQVSTNELLVLQSNGVYSIRTLDLVDRDWVATQDIEKKGEASMSVDDLLTDKNGNVFIAIGRGFP